MVLVLVGAYRSLGGAPPTAGDSTLLLRALHDELRRSLTALIAQLDAAGDQAGESDAARDGRKVSASVQQTLDRLPPAAQLDENDAAAQALLAAAAEDTSWAWRMLQGPAASPALAAAATILADHASGCCDQVETLLAAPAGGEPRQRA